MNENAAPQAAGLFVQPGGKQEIEDGRKVLIGLVADSKTVVAPLTEKVFRGNALICSGCSSNVSSTALKRPFSAVDPKNWTMC